MRGAVFETLFHSVSELPMSCTVAFIGTGIMGSPMAEHLIANGHQLHVHNRTREKTKFLLEQGAVWHDTPESAAAASAAVITMLGLPADVNQVYFGQEGAGGILTAAKPGSLLIDMTTSSPNLAERISQAAEERGMESLDAPVSGGDVGARNASLVVMVGGRQEAFNRGAVAKSIGEVDYSSRAGRKWPAV